MTEEPRTAENKATVVKTLLCGALIGAVIGYLLRPSVPLIGQLPFGTVITRGAALDGLNVVLRSVAQTSFNYLLVGTIFGAAAGGLAGALLENQQRAGE